MVASVAFKVVKTFNIPVCPFVITAFKLYVLLPLNSKVPLFAPKSILGVVRFPLSCSIPPFVKLILPTNTSFTIVTF